MKEKFQQDLTEIKNIMDRSSRFISLSGLSGVSIGFIALSGAYLAHLLVLNDLHLLHLEAIQITTTQLLKLLLLALATFVLSAVAATYFTFRQTRARGEKLWDVQVKRLIINLALPLLTGGLLCLMLLFKGYVALSVALSLVFYGLALINAGKYSMKEIRGEGLIQIVLGLAAIEFPGYGLILWAIGFGLIHIIFGIILKVKYQS